MRPLKKGSTHRLTIGMVLQPPPHKIHAPLLFSMEKLYFFLTSIQAMKKLTRTQLYRICIFCLCVRQKPIIVTWRKRSRKENFANDPK